MKQTSLGVQEAISAFYKRDYNSTLKILVSRFGTTNYAQLEDVLQEAVLTALQKWPESGIPDNCKAWIEELAQKGIYVSGEQLEPEVRRLQGKSKELNDGPFTESKEIISGIFIINAKDFDHAVEIAKDCPIYGFNGNVEIRPLMQLRG